MEAAGAAITAEIRVQLEKWASEHNYRVTDEYDPEFAFQVSFTEHIGDPTAALTLMGRLSDLIICFRPNRASGASQRIFDTALSATGRLTLVVPKNPPDEILKHVVIAWDGSLQISHVLAQATSFLRTAGRVSIFCYPDANVDMGLSQLMQYLACHGITARQIESRHLKSIGESLIEAAKTKQASLLLMGAYGHTRMHEFFLGGVTRHLLKHTTVPLLMAH
ncbi:universal stress protein [Dongia soli]|uniref:Universal stress protein n=1 Tax=Dongia soli TaxID=600628 RepID=A0ABU5EFI8_9PROT|nr:universal stress protein [Dongia soli]